MVNPPAQLQDPLYSDYAAQELKALLQAYPWIEVEDIYGVVRTGVYSGKAEDELRGKTYPQIYAGTGKKNFNISPSTKKNVYIFFESNGFGMDFKEDEGQLNMSLILWGQLNKIDPSKDYDYTPELIQDVLSVLTYFEASSVRVIEEPEEVFSKYTLYTQVKNQFLMRPYTAFKIEFVIPYRKCL